MSSYSTYLFAIPSWAEGAGRLGDFGDTLTQYNDSPTPEYADALALYLDWYAVGDDLRQAMSQYADEEAVAS